MNYKNILIVALIVIIIYLFWKKSGKNQKIFSGQSNYIKLGDKGKDVKGLQEVINNLFNDDVVSESGVFDKKTKEYSDKIFEGSGYSNKTGIQTDIIEPLRKITGNSIKIVFSNNEQQTK
ncbi:MAG: hypothetical protein WCT85_00675 [Parachlamydiales bacterium]|jgi:hypothetical protein